ncbi:MAG: hypothetical protein RL215_1393 [Planctomycetota bacterium]
MVHEDAAADACSGVDIDAEDFGDAILEVDGDEFAALFPEPCGDAPGGEGVDAFEEQEWNEAAFDGGVTFLDGDDICADGCCDGGILFHGELHDFAELHGGECFGGEFSGEVEADGVFEPLVVEDGGMEEAGEHGFSGGAFCGAAADAGPECSGVVVDGGLSHGKWGGFGKRCGQGSGKQAGITPGLLETGRRPANPLSS